MDLEGTVLDRYRLVRLLGAGGMSDVYLAEDARIGQQVAIKVMRGDRFDSDARRTQRFLREVKAVAQLDHPHILPLFDYGEVVLRDIPIMYLVMPVRKEGSLADWLQKPENAARLTVQDIAALLRQAASALQHAHEKQIIHQDVKPSNFLLRYRQDTYLPDLFLTDFGIARFSTASSSSSQTPGGTPNYMASEQWSAHPVPATDQYALAVMAYELLTKQPPFQGGPHQVMYQHFATLPQPPSALDGRVTPELDRVVLRGLAKEPAARFPSIMAFAEAFEQAARHVPPARMQGSAASNFTARTASSSATALDEKMAMRTAPSSNGVWTTAPSPGSSYPAPGTNPASFSQAQSSDPTIVPSFPTPPPTSPPPAPQKRWRRPGVILSVVLIVLLLLAGAISLPFVLHQRPSLVNGSPTPTSLPHSATPSVTSSATAFAVPTKWKVALDDPLRDNSKGYRWEESNSALFGTKCAFSGGAYVAGVGAGDINICTAGTTNFSDLAYEVRMTLTSGDCGGIAFRGNVNLDLTSPTYQFYYFSLCQDGTYGFSVVNGADSGNSTRTHTQLIHAGLHQANTLGVIARGQAIELFINGQRVVTQTDNTYARGIIGVVADGDNNATSATFSDAKVWTP